VGVKLTANATPFGCIVPSIVSKSPVRPAKVSTS
jgi:hypothetical protein